jgi:hypothetical protein
MIKVYLQNRDAILEMRSQKKDGVLREPKGSVLRRLRLLSSLRFHSLTVLRTRKVYKNFRIALRSFTMQICLRLLWQRLYAASSSRRVQSPDLAMALRCMWEQVPFIHLI